MDALVELPCVEPLPGKKPAGVVLEPEVPELLAEPPATAPRDDAVVAPLLDPSFVLAETCEDDPPVLSPTLLDKKLRKTELDNQVVLDEAIDPNPG